MNVLFPKARSFWVWAYLATAVLGGVVVWIVGHRGIYLYDQSGIFDGAWRMLQGQVLYRDFYAPYGPVVFWIQSWFFRLAGVDFSSMVLAAAAINAVAILCVIGLVCRLLPDDLHRLTAIGAGLVTAVWFQAPTGTLWFEQTSFCFNLIALLFVIEAGFASERSGIFLRVTAGCSLAIAILSKQSAGVILLPVPVGVIAITYFGEWRRLLVALFQVAAGVLLVTAVFVLWLWQFSSLTGFWGSVVVMSRVLAATRVGRVRSVTDLILLRDTLPFVRVALVAFLIFAVSSRGAFSSRRNIRTSWILLAYIFLQNIFASLTLNEVQNSVGYVGLINGLAFGLLSQAVERNRFAGEWLRRAWATAAVLLVSAYFLFYRPIRNGWDASASRIVQQFDPKTSFAERLDVPGASRVRWGEPTLIDDVRVTREDFENVNAWLAQANTNFFVFPYSTLLYGLHRRVSPQPWLYFMPDHSFVMSDIARVDAVIVESLQANKVTAIVMEKSSSSHNDELLRKMPRLEAWLHNQFQKTKEFGFYEVWTLRAPSS